MTNGNGGNNGRGGNGNGGNGNGGGQGFAGMDPERQREIASEGGRAAQESGNAHQLTREEAAEGEWQRPRVHQRGSPRSRP